ncbi:glycine zipper 2TM domain-containing protein [Ignatzschineria larvae DSM 13226]|uniref:Glycine zipper 2TM domain-containing protein n=1 Tax=Ignatzschineria larvae DSM 13226 TaxID=1111732 RepID=A0ABZ3C2L5_9GAMM|nr:glycine zipper 2TM domain-containing protein [Ignatzschineria larvae]
MKSMMKGLMVVSVIAMLAGCSTWDGMSKSQKGMVVGTGVGAVAGEAVTDTILGTAGGAAVGAFVGSEIGKNL